MEHINKIYKFALMIKDISIPKKDYRYNYDFLLKEKYRIIKRTK